MPRAVDGTRRKDHRKKNLGHSKGFWGRRHSNYKVAKDAVAKALYYSYRDRRDKKGTFRRLWIARINAACRAEGLSYSGPKMLGGKMSYSGQSLAKNILTFTLKVVPFVPSVRTKS